MKPKISALRQAGLACSTVFVTLTTPALHAGQIWDGGGTNYNWNAANNWDSNTLPNFANPITFEGNARNSGSGPLHNLAAGLTVGGINFTNDGSTGKTAAFTVNGTTQSTTNSMTLGGDITTTASSSAISDLMHRSLDVILNGNRTITTDTNHNLRIDGQISETGGSWSITKEGVGQMTLGNNSLTTNPNSFSGGININNGAVSLVGSATLGSSAAGTGTINLGATADSNDAELRLAGSGMNPTNALVVRTGSTGTKTLANRTTNSVIYKGIITADDNLTILAANGGGRLTVDAAGSTIANGKTVSFTNTGAATNAMINSATWGGQGGISYTSSSTMGFEVRGDNTYSGGTTLGAMSDTGILIATSSSVFTGPTLTSGAFGTGTLSIGATKMRGGTTANISIGNAITFTDNPTFTTTTSEKSVIFTGDATLGATRTLTVETGSTVSTEGVEFSGAISGSGFGIIKEGVGNLRLSGTNSYTGATTVNAGTLEITSTGSTDAASAVTVSGTGTALVVNGTLNGTLVANVSTVVSGTGSVAGAASVSGDLNPGNSPGVLSFESDLTMAGSTATTMEIIGTVRGTDYDGIDVGATLTYDGSLTLALGTTFGAGSYTFNLFDLFTGTSGDFDSVSLSGDYTASFTNGGSGVWTASTNSGNESWTFTQGTGDLALTVIPEPHAALLGSLGLLALMRRRR